IDWKFLGEVRTTSELVVGSAWMSAWPSMPRRCSSSWGEGEGDASWGPSSGPRLPKRLDEPPEPLRPPPLLPKLLELLLPKGLLLLPDCIPLKGPWFCWFGLLLFMDCCDIEPDPTW